MGNICFQSGNVGWFEVLLCHSPAFPLFSTSSVIQKVPGFISLYYYIGEALAISSSGSLWPK